MKWVETPEYVMIARRREVEYLKGSRKRGALLIAVSLVIVFAEPIAELILEVLGWA